MNIERMPLVLDVAAVAELLGCSEDTVRGAIDRGELEHFRVGRLLRVSKHGFLRFIGCAPISTGPRPVLTAVQDIEESA